MDRLSSLIAFARVVETGGFSSAARRLNLSVTMVSNHVQALEEHLGARLLNRTTRKVGLTEIGKEYYERAMRVLTDLEEADRMAGAAQATPTGTLRLFAGIHIARFLAPVISEFLRTYPAMSIDLSIGERTVDLVEEGFDLAIRPLPPPDSNLIVRRLTPWRCVLVCSTDYLVNHETLRHPADLSRHNCLRYAFYPYGDEWRFTGPGGEPVSARVSGNVVTNSGEVLLHLALTGHGLFLAPTFLVEDDLRAGRLVTPLPDYIPPEFAINATYPDRHYLSSKVRIFIDLAARRFAEHRLWLDPERAASGLRP